MRSGLHDKLIEKMANITLPDLSKKLLPTPGKGPSGIFSPTDPHAGMPISPSARTRMLARAQGLPAHKKLGPEPPQVNKPTQQESGVTPSTAKAKVPGVPNPVKTMKPPRVLSKQPGGDKLPGKNQIY